MKKLTGILVLIALIVIVVIQLKVNKSTTENRVFILDKNAPIAVFAETVSNIKSVNGANYSGNFEAMNEVKLNAEVQGLIVDVLVDEGQHVKKGQALVRINDDMLQLKLSALKTQIAGLKKDEARYSILVKEDAIQGIKLEKTQLALDGLLIEQNSILDQIRKTTVRAPFNGTISMKFCEKGGFASPAMPLMELVNMDRMKFVINVPEGEIDLFNSTTDYWVKTDIDPSKNIPVKWIQTSPKGNFGNSFKVEFLVDQYPNLKSKMFGTIGFATTGKKSDQLEISKKSILGSESHPEIYIIKGGKAIRSSIVIQRRVGDKLFVSKGIEIGDTIITGGFINLFDNANVKVSSHN